MNIYFRSGVLFSSKSKEIVGKKIGLDKTYSNLKGKSKSLKKDNCTLSYVTREEFNQAIADGLVVYGDPFIL